MCEPASITELMEEAGFDPDYSCTANLMQDQHYGASLVAGFKLLGDYYDE